MLEDTLIGICPQDHLYVRIHNTVADVTMVNNPKDNSIIDEREDEPEMADVLKNLVVP